MNSNLKNSNSTVNNNVISTLCEIKALLCERKALLEKDVENIKTEIANLPICNLLRMKYVIKTSFTDFKGKKFFIIVFTVIITELIKWLTTDENKASNINETWFGVVILSIIIWSIYIAFSQSFPILTYSKEIKKGIIIELIDIEIEKRKKAPENNTSAEND